MATREATAACDDGGDSSLQGLDPCGVGDGEADPEAGSVRCRRRRRHGAGRAPTGGLGLRGRDAQLSTGFYSSSCPGALGAVTSVVQSAVANEPRMGASILRLFFHNYFVQGCDGSLLLDDTASF
ncbi:hypothetical protein ZWY2020_046004 [Hordeum vulgare]|nr:hypothetical protein ZWY2020_046004 [Hordeum vulgare]